MTNVDLLKRTLAYVEDHPAEWDQRQYVCGTTMCFAGHAVVLSGYPIDEQACTPLDVLPPDLQARFEFNVGGVVHAAELAAALLGIEDRTLDDDDSDDPWAEPAADVLFMATNDIGDLRRMVAELCDWVKVTS